MIILEDDLNTKNNQRIKTTQKHLLYFSFVLDFLRGQIYCPIFCLCSTFYLQIIGIIPYYTNLTGKQAGAELCQAKHSLS